MERRIRLVCVDSPPRERRDVIEYFLSQSPEGTVVRHAEKVASERIYGFKHDVWDVDSSDGRWWVITNPTNLIHSRWLRRRVWIMRWRSISG